MVLASFFIIMISYIWYKFNTMIKITTPNDFFMFRAIVDARENSQIFGI